MFPRFANPAAQLGVFRAATYAALLLVVDPRVAAHYAAYPDALLAPPGFWRGVLEGDWMAAAWGAIVSPHAGWIAYAAFVGAGAMAMVGYRARAAQVVAIVAGGFVLSIAQFYGKVNHYHHLLWFAMLLAASPCADVLSIDAVREAGRRAGLAMRSREAYELPLRFVWGLLVLIYFFPGVWKLTEVGSAWATPANVIGILHAKWAETGRVPWVRVDHWPWLCGVIGVSTMAFENAFAPLTLAGRWPRRVAAAFGVLFHLSIWLVMDIRIGHVVVGYLALIDVSGVFRPICVAKDRCGVHDRATTTSPWPRWPVYAVGIALIAGNVYDGVARREDWPLGMYPAFAWRAPMDHVTVEITAEWADGRRRVLTPLDLARYTTPERAAATSLMAANDDARAGASRGERQRAIWAVWTALDPTLCDASRVRFERVARLVKPEALGVETERLVIGELDVQLESPAK